MPNQVTAGQKRIVFPDGSAFEVSKDDGATYTNMGVSEGGFVFTYNFDKIEVETGNDGKLSVRVKNESLALAPSALLSTSPVNWEKFSGGAFTYETTAATPETGATQDTVADAYNYLQFIKIENQNFDISAITVNSVTGATDGLLVDGTDFDIVQNGAGEFGIQIIDSVTVTTMDQVFTIDYDYTPAESTQISAGQSSVVLDDFMIRVRHYTDDALSIYDFELLVSSCDMDSGMSFNMKGANEDGVNSATVAFTAKNKDSLASGKKLFTYKVFEAAIGED